MVKSYDDVCVSFFGEMIPIGKMGRANMRKNNELVSPKASDEGFILISNETSQIPCFISCLNLKNFVIHE